MRFLWACLTPSSSALPIIPSEPESRQDLLHSPPLPSSTYRLQTSFLARPHRSRGTGQQKTCLPSSSRFCVARAETSKSILVDRVSSAPNQKTSTTVKSSIPPTHHISLLPGRPLLHFHQPDPPQYLQYLTFVDSAGSETLQAISAIKHTSSLPGKQPLLLYASPIDFLFLSPRLLSFPLLCAGIFKASLSAATLSEALVHNPPSSAVLPGFLTSITELSLLPPSTVLPTPKYLRPIHAKLRIVISFARLFSNSLV